MALTVPNETDIVIDKFLGPAQQRMQELGGAITGAGPGAQEAYQSMSKFASSLVDVGSSTAESVKKLRMDETLPSAHRLLEGNARISTAKTLRTKLNDGMHSEHGKLEQALTTALLPAPHRDPAARALNLKRAELRFGHLSGEGLVSAIQKRIGIDPVHDSELLSETGSDFFAGKDVNEDQVAGLRVAAREAYLQRNDGTRTQAAARLALTKMRELNIKGQLAAFDQAARMHLSKLD